MASLGRIIIMPKDKYNEETAYTMLDVVTHNGSVWICKKTAVGIEPSENNVEYWMKLFDSDKEIYESISLTSDLEGLLAIPVKENYEVVSVMSKTDGYTLVGNTSSVYLHSLDSGSIGNLALNKECTVAITYVKK